jgi:hypothetical protein
MPAEVHAEGRNPGISQPGGQPQHLFFATAISMGEYCTGRRSWGSEEIRRYLMSILRQEVIELH